MERRRLLTTALGAGTLSAVPLAAASTTADRTASWRRVPHRGIRPDDPEGRAPLPNPRRGFRYEMSYNARDLTSPWASEQDHSPDAARP
ncbi:hypothetical protein ABZY36_13285 [Streptomyces sp. NPDC006627]|uniref:hypothetical protein n=1 Tax=Streptomyces sp. NPDC006627 TaxID=3154679 RepID=UPI0033A82F05